MLRLSTIRIASLIAALALLLGTATTGHAQATPDSKTLNYGDTVTAEITDAAQNVAFQFSGKAKDVVTVQFMPIANKDYSSLSSPIFTLQNDKGRKIADSSKSSVIVFGGGSGQAFVVQLPSDGSYTIGIARNADSTTNGSFTLNINTAQILEAGKAVKGTISSKAKGLVYGAIYAIESTSDFGLKYALSNADYTPSLRIEAVDDSGVIYSVGVLAGNKILSGALDIAGSKNLYIVTIGDLQQDVQDTSASEEKADYSLTLTALSTK